MAIVGFDLGKRKSQVCIGTPEGVVTAERRIDTSREALEELVKKHEITRVLIEASTSAEWVARHLESLIVEVVVGDPRFGPMYAKLNNKIKTDKRDARALFEALRLDAFQHAHRRSDQSRAIRDLLLTRTALVRTRAKLVITVRSLLELYGYKPAPCSVERFVATLEECRFRSG